MVVVVIVLDLLGPLLLQIAAFLSSWTFWLRLVAWAVLELLVVLELLELLVVAQREQTGVGTSIHEYQVGESLVLRTQLQVASREVWLPRLARQQSRRPQQ